MKGFSKMELAGSLAIPILTFLWGSIYTIDRLRWGAEFFGESSSNLAYPLAVIFGGILPIFLTLKYKIHTEDYLKKRIIQIIIIRVILGLIGASFALKIMPRFFIYIVVCLGAIFYEVFKVQEEYTTGGERAVLMLSDPIIYWSLEVFISCFIEIVDLGPYLEYYGWF